MMMEAETKRWITFTVVSESKFFFSLLNAFTLLLNVQLLFASIWGSAVLIARYNCATLEAASMWQSAEICIKILWIINRDGGEKKKQIHRRRVHACPGRLCNTFWFTHFVLEWKFIKITFFLLPSTLYLHGVPVIVNKRIIQCFAN